MVLSATNNSKNSMEDVYLIDNHTHGAFGVNFNYASYDEVKYVLEEFYKRNIKGVCPTLVGDDDKNIVRQLSIFKEIKESQLKYNKKEALLIGAHLEGTFLSPDKPGIQDKSVFKIPSIENFKQTVGEFEDIVKIVTIAPEEDINLINYLNSRGIKTQAGHTKGEILKNCAGATHIFNAMNPIHHRASSIALESLIRDDIYIEVIADTIHLSIDILKLILKTKPISKIMLVSDCLPCAGFNKDIIFCGKKVNANGKDDKGVLAGSAMTLDMIASNLLRLKILNKEDLRQVGFKNQIDYLKLTNEEIAILNR